VLNLAENAVKARLAIVALALDMRLVFQGAAVGFEAAPVADAMQYDAIARNLAGSGPFITDEGLRSTRAPAFPFFLAGVYALFGHSWSAARAAQAVLGAVTCDLIVLLGTALLGYEVGILAGLGYAVYPYAVFWCGFLLSEPLCGLLTTAAVLALIRARDSLSWAVLWPFLAGLAALSRPNMGLLFVFGTGWLFWQGGRRVRRIFGTVVIFTITLTPWTIRNYQVHHRLVPITTLGGWVLWEGNNPYVDADPSLRGRSAAASKLPEAAGTERLSETETDALYFRLAVRFLRDHPDAIPRLVVAKFLRLWNLFPNLESRWQRLIATTSVSLLFAGFLAGLWHGWRRRVAGIVPLLLPVLAVMVTAAVYWADARIRAPAEPVIMLIAAYGTVNLAESLRRSWAHRRVPTRSTS